MNWIAFIDTQYIKQKSIVEDNVDDKLLEYYIRKAQDIHTQVILGEDLYNSLMAQAIQASTGGYFNSQFYLQLAANYVQPALLEWTIYESIPWINWKLTNKAIVQQTSEKATGIATSDLKWLRSLQQSNAAFYDQRVREFIINNPSEFPEYYQLNGVERIPPASLTGFNYVYTNKYPKGARGRRSDWWIQSCCGPSGTQISF